MCCLIKCFGKKLSGWHKNRKVFSGISPSANICSLCAWQASLPIFERQMRTHSAQGQIQKGCKSINSHLSARWNLKLMRAVFDERTGRQNKKDTLPGGVKLNPQLTGISPLANICSLCAWQASLPIFERQMRTHSARELCKKGSGSLNAY